MPANFGNSILGRATLLLLLVSLVIGLMTSAVTAQNTRKVSEREVAARIHSLIDTVEASVQIASFVRDAEMARQIARGLLSNREIRFIRIRDDSTTLAELVRNDDGAIVRGAAPADQLITRPVVSPFDVTGPIGTIELALDQRVIDERIDHAVSRAVVASLLQLLLICGFFILTIYSDVLRPIRTLSHGMQALQPTRGERLSVPHRHERSEIGRLVGDINALAERLVHSLNEERLLRARLEKDERKYRSIFDHAQSGICLLDDATQLLECNDAAARLIGRPPDIAGPTDFARLPWHDPALVTQAIDRARSAQITQSLAAGLDLNGETRWLSLALSPIDSQALQVVIHDITAHKQAELNVRRELVTDALTRLPNRAGMTNALQHALAQPAPLHVLLIDIDRFRGLVEGAGLPAGDDVLRTAALRLNAIAQPGGIAGRLGADQFLMLLPATDGPVECAQRVHQSFLRPFPVDGSSSTLTISIGVCECPEHAGDVASALRHVELALDDAKRRGGNQSVVFDPHFVAQARARQAMERALHQAVVTQSFELYFQPVVDLVTLRTCGAEALIRWPRADGMINPAQFIPMAEDNGLIVEIGVWVLEQTCAQLRRWTDQGCDYTVSLNVSARQIPEGLKPDQVRSVIARYGIDARRIGLEVTEGVLLRETAAAAEWITAMRGLGLRIYLDDFGTGYSSLSYLKRLALDTVKIDRAFVQDMETSVREQALVRAIIAMADSLDMNVVAEGIETRAHLDLLRSMGCGRAQGFFFSRPVPVKAFADVVRDIDRSLGGSKLTQGLLPQSSRS